MTNDPRPPRMSFAERLDELFRTVHNPETGRPYSIRQVASACGLSHTHLNKLRSGQASDPRRSEMEVIARFFGVPLAHFTDDPAPDNDRPDVAVQAQLAAAFSHADVERVALRMMERRLSPAGVEAVVAIIDEVARLEAAQRRQAGDVPLQ